MTKGSGAIAVTGGNSLLGQHLIKWLIENGQHVSVVRVWHPTEHFVKRIELPCQSVSFDAQCISSTIRGDILEMNDKGHLRKVESFVGKESLEQFLEGVKKVFNLHEVQDFSLVPDKQKMWEENVNGVWRLMAACRLANVLRVVHLSSAFINTSIRWPKSNLVEITNIPPHSEAPFPDYIKSKLESERIVFEHDDIQTMVVRLCPLFGEGDQSSVVCDAIRFAQWNICGKLLPVIGDRSGVLQLTYAGNAACGVARVMEKMVAQPTLTKEALFVLDDTPKKDVYTVMEPVLKSRNITLFSMHIPFFLIYLLYMLYRLCSWPLLLLSKLWVLPTALARLPSPSVLYMTFYHGTFFSPSKSPLLLGFVAPFSFDEAIRRSVIYYKSLNVAFLPQSARSWRNVH